MKLIHKTIQVLFLSCFSFLTINAQLQSAAVVSVYTQGAKISPEMAESVLRIVTTKSEQFNVLDKLDLQEIINDSKIDVSNCYIKNFSLSAYKYKYELPREHKVELKNFTAYFAYLQNSKMKNWNQLFKDFDHSFLTMVLDNLSKVLVNLSEDGSILKDFGISFKAFCQLKDWPNAISFEL